MNKIRVFIIDDSAVVRQVLGELVTSFNECELVGTAPDPVIALAKMEKNWPDVIITDIEMPKKDGLTFIEEIMKTKPTPFIVCSAVAGMGAALTVRALSLGAIDVIEKPKIGVKEFLEESRTVLIDAIRSAGSANVKKIRPAPLLNPEPKLSADVIIPSSLKGNSKINGEKIVIIGASAGGTNAIEQILTSLDENTPPIAIVQHMPEVFTKAFADRLNTICKITVKEASNGDMLTRNLALIAPGGKHMLINTSEKGFSVTIKEGPLVSRHRPSVDVLFRSAAKNAASSALGIILTGMGDDGAVGMKEMHDAGIFTIAQNEESCAVFGMPKEAIKRGAVDKIIHLDAIANTIIAWGRST
jgi:two-component system, chemotaxis family, protein-glutamate methylesterase/glutaminase